MKIGLLPGFVAAALTVAAPGAGAADAAKAEALGQIGRGVMVMLGHWAQHIVTFRAGAAEFIREVDWIYKVHLFFGLTVFLLFPFTHLVHVWSGFAALGYLARAYQIVRSRA